MGALDNTRRINQAIIFLPTNEERQISNLRGRNQMLEERLAKIENFILRKDLDNPIESSGTGPACSGTTNDTKRQQKPTS